MDSLNDRISELLQNASDKQIGLKDALQCILADFQSETGTSAFSAILGYVLGGGSFPSFTHWSMSVISARQYH